MAIYDPPDGSVDPRPRCEGHCCRCFSLEKPYATVLSEAQKEEEPGYRSVIPDVKVIARMLVPLGTVRGGEIFTCRHLGKSGDCTIYETRPKMCRDFPGPNPCTYRNCASHGPQPLWKRAWNWLVS